MSSWLSLCLGLLLWAPSLALAQLTATLEIPGDGDTLSGIGVISGWKCEATAITVVIDDGAPIPMLHGSERGDTSGVCGDTPNGFVAIFNWALLEEGEHDAVAYDNGEVFARSTFEVATTGVEFLADVDVRVRATDFPSPGETTWFQWNEGTQHLEINRTVLLEDVCGLIPDRQAPTSSIEAPLLQPPPCRVQETGGEISTARATTCNSIMTRLSTIEPVMQREGRCRWGSRKEEFPGVSAPRPTDGSGFLARSARRTGSTWAPGHRTATLQESSSGASTPIKIVRGSGKTPPAVGEPSRSLRFHGNIRVWTHKYVTTGAR